MITAIHLHPNTIAIWVENSAYLKEWINMQIIHFAKKRQKML